MSFLSENMLSILVACIVVLLAVSIKKRLSYFLNRGLPYVSATWADALGSFTISNFNDFPQEAYDRCREADTPYIGFFHTLLKPSVLIRDPALVGNILIKDFSYFQDHGFDIDFKMNPLAGHLFNMKGDEWRTLRHKLVPTFTSGKLRGMVPIMEECADKLIEDIKQNPKFQEDTNLKVLFKRFSLSVMASCAFGIDPEGIKDPNCEFCQVLNEIVYPSPTALLRFPLLLGFPALMKKLKVKFFAQRIENFILNITRDTMEMRKKTGVKRNDFIQLLLELREKGSVELDVKDLEQDEKETINELQTQPPSSKLELTDELLAAQVFVFLIGGFENTAYLPTITTYLLSKHPDIRARVVDEVNQVKNKHGGFDYQAIREMKLLGACIDEALRLYPPAPILMRESNKPYTFSDGKKIEKGVSVILPTRALQSDSKYWTDPEVFNPDRFLDSDIVPGSYLPFGDGPRICIAQRMALLMAKLLMAKLVTNFDLLPSSITKEPIKIKVLIAADNKGGFWGSFKELNK